MRYIFYLFLLPVFINCAVLKYNTDLDIDFQIINKSIKLPSNDHIACIDTVLIQLRNNSNYEYVFDIADSTAFYFYNTKEENKFIDPFGGFGCAFLDKDRNYLNVYGNSVFNPEAFEDIESAISNKFAMTLPPKASTIFKVPIIFPNEISFKSFVQKVPNINQSMFVEIFFRPTNNYLNHLVKEGHFKLKENQKIMNLYKKAILPVRFECFDSAP